MVRTYIDSPRFADDQDDMMFESTQFNCININNFQIKL